MSTDVMCPGRASRKVCLQVWKRKVNDPFVFCLVFSIIKISSRSSKSSSFEFAVLVVVVLLLLLLLSVVTLLPISVHIIVGHLDVFWPRNIENHIFYLIISGGEYFTLPPNLCTSMPFGRCKESPKSLIFTFQSSPTNMLENLRSL